MTNTSMSGNKFACWVHVALVQLQFLSAKYGSSGTRCSKTIGGLSPEKEVHLFCSIVSVHKTLSRDTLKICLLLNCPLSSWAKIHLSFFTPLLEQRKNSRIFCSVASRPKFLTRIVSMYVASLPTYLSPWAELLPSFVTPWPAYLSSWMKLFPRHVAQCRHTCVSEQNYSLDMLLHCQRTVAEILSRANPRVCCAIASISEFLPRTNPEIWCSIASIPEFLSTINPNISCSNASILYLNSWVESHLGNVALLAAYLSSWGAEPQRTAAWFPVCCYCSSELFSLYL